MARNKAQRIAVTVRRDAAAPATGPARVEASSVDVAPVQASLVQEPVAPAAPAKAPAKAKAEPVDERPHWQRDDPMQNDGAKLRELAWKAGIPRSECDRMTDAQLRTQLQQLTYAAFED